MNANPAKPPERMSKKKKAILVLLFAVLLLCFVAGALLMGSSKTRSQADLSSDFFSRIQRLDGGSLAVEFDASKEVPGGVGLQNWLEVLESRDAVSGVRIAAQATYVLDNRGEWDLLQKGDRWIVTAPWPELKGLRLASDGIKIETSGKTLTAEQERVATDLIREKAVSFLRQDEDTRRDERLSAIRDKVREFALSALDLPSSTPMDVHFAGETTATDETP